MGPMAYSSPGRSVPMVQGMDPRRSTFQKLEGRAVNLALSGGTRIDGAMLVFAGGQTLWIFTNGDDHFVPIGDVLDVWEAAAA